MAPLINIVILGLLVLGLLSVWGATLVWVNRDAEKLGKPGILVALLIGFIAWPVGLLVWLILRADYLKAKAPAPPRACPRCGRALASETAHGLCPACLLQQATASESGAPNPSTFTPPSVAELAPLFPQLEILELLGRGGMGAVYKARQPGLDRFVALKVLPATTGADPAFAERFQREARALAALNHPHIVAVYDFGQLPTLSYFIMEYVDGVNLRQLERTARLSPREALAIVPQICEALQFAHDRGIVHRDIKPENILVDKQGRVKIADFGLAKLLRVEPGGFALTETRNVVGTPQYMAPEQVEKPQTVDHRADIYSLGVVFYEMLTGELPMGRFPVPSQRVQVDVRLDEVVLKALEKEPDRRYQQASAFKTNVETFSAAPGQTAPVPPSAAPPAIGTPAPSKLPDARTGLQYAFMGAASMVSSLLWGLAAGIRVIKAFHIIPGQMANRSVDLDAAGLVQGIHSAQLSLAIMAMFGFAGLSFLGVALFRHRYRARWFFWTLCATAVLMLVAFPVGTVLGVVLLVYVSRRRVEFVTESPQVSSGSSSPEPTLAALSPGQRAGQFAARVLYVMAALIALWPVIALIVDFNDPGHGPRFALCWVIAAIIVVLGRVLQLWATPANTTPRKSRVWVWVLFIVLAVPVLLVGLVVALLFRPLRPRSSEAIQAPLAQPVTPTMGSWLTERSKESGPVWVEVCTPTELAALKLADGSLQRERTQGTYNDKDVWNFMVRTGGDLRVHRQDGAWWLLMRDGRLTQIVDTNWDKPDKSVIAAALAANNDAGMLMEGCHAYRLTGGLPTTYAFFTSEGGLGVLQVQGQQTGGPTDRQGKLSIAVKTFRPR